LGAVDNEDLPGWKEGHLWHHSTLEHPLHFPALFNAIRCECDAAALVRGGILAGQIEGRN
jgi:hypothetical protein